MPKFSVKKPLTVFVAVLAVIILGVEAGACAFFHQRRTKTEDGRIYEYTRSYIRGDRVRLDAHMQKGAITFTRTID